MRQIKTIEELKERATDNQIDCFISLAGGLAKSSKTVEFMTDENKFWIHNDIDGSEQTLTAEELSTESNIGEAIQKGALYLYE